MNPDDSPPFGQGREPSKCGSSRCLGCLTPATRPCRSQPWTAPDWLDQVRRSLAPTAQVGHVSRNPQRQHARLKGFAENMHVPAGPTWHYPAEFFSPPSLSEGGLHVSKTVCYLFTGIPRPQALRVLTANPVSSIAIRGEDGDEARSAPGTMIVHLYDYCKNRVNTMTVIS